MLKAELQLYNGTKGKVLTYYGRWNLCLYVQVAGVLGLAPGFYSASGQPRGAKETPRG